MLKQIFNYMGLVPLDSQTKIIIKTRFALELHMVHEGKNGMAVVTVLYKIGRADTFIRSVYTK